MNRPCLFIVAVKPTVGKLYTRPGLRILTLYREKTPHLGSQSRLSLMEYALSKNYAWAFGSDGSQFELLKYHPRFALAVRDGDVAAAPVTTPEPGTWMLLGSGLVGLVTCRKKLARK